MTKEALASEEVETLSIYIYPGQANVVSTQVQIAYLIYYFQIPQSCGWHLLLFNSAHGVCVSVSCNSRKTDSDS